MHHFVAIPKRSDAKKQLLTEKLKTDNFISHLRGGCPTIPIDHVRQHIDRAWSLQLKGGDVMLETACVTFMVSVLSQVLVRILGKHFNF